MEVKCDPSAAVWCWSSSRGRGLRSRLMGEAGRQRVPCQVKPLREKTIYFSEVVTRELSTSKEKSRNMKRNI